MSKPSIPPVPLLHVPLSSDIQIPESTFIKKDLRGLPWEEISLFFESLIGREVSDSNDFEKWMNDYSELLSSISDLIC